MIYFSDIWQNSSVGLDVQPDVVRVVEIVKYFNRVILLRHGEEKISPPSLSIKDLSAAIERLFSRLKIRQKEVVIHHSGKDIRTCLLQSPVLEPNELGEWIRSQISQKFPSHIDITQWPVSYHIVNQTEDAIGVLVAYCRPDTLSERIQILEHVGLKPVMVGAGRLDIFLASVFGYQDFFEKSYCLIESRNAHVECLLIRGGNPVGLYQFEKKNFNYSDCLSRLKNETDFFPEKIILMNGQIFNSVEKDSKHAEHVAETGYPMKGLIASKSALESGYHLASGLALKRFFPFLNTIDLLPEEKKKSIRFSNERKLAFRIVLSTGFILFMLLFILYFIKFGLIKKNNLAEEQLLLLNDRIVQVERLINEKENSYHTFKEIKALFMQKSQSAQLLAMLCEVIPEKVWFQKLSYKTFEKSDAGLGKNEKYQIVIDGLAFDETGVALFLSGLENNRYFENIRLLNTKTISGREVWEMSKIQRIQLIQFSVSMELNQ